MTSSFEYFPGVPIFHSRDLVSWRQIGHCLNRQRNLPLAAASASGGIWAPTLRHNDGVFYMTTTNMSVTGNFIVTATRPEGPWSDPVLVAQPGIDPSLFFDDDGSVLYTTSHEGALQSRIDVTSGRLLSEPKVIWTGTGGQYPEGPHLYRRDGWYYLLLSEGGTEYGHMITFARRRTPWGPFEPCLRNPLLTHRSWKRPIQGLGHADLVETPDGAWFAVALGFRPNGYPPSYHLGRETFLSPVTWADDGFPVFANHGRLALEEETPLELDPPPAAAVRDDFTERELALLWNYLRNPHPAHYSLDERPGHLRLRGSSDGLDDIASPAWVGRRQSHFSVHVAACLEFQAETEGEEAGLVVRMNEQHHYEIFVTQHGGVPSVVLRRRIGSLRAEVACEPLPESDRRWVLAIEADREKYVFSYGLAIASCTRSVSGKRAICRRRSRTASPVCTSPCMPRATARLARSPRTSIGSTIEQRQRLRWHSQCSIPLPSVCRLWGALCTHGDDAIHFRVRTASSLAASTKRRNGAERLATLGK